MWITGKGFSSTAYPPLQTPLILSFDDVLEQSALLHRDHRDLPPEHRRNARLRKTVKHPPSGSGITGLPESGLRTPCIDRSSGSRPDRLRRVSARQSKTVLPTLLDNLLLSEHRDVSRQAPETATLREPSFEKTVEQSENPNKQPRDVILGILLCSPLLLSGQTSNPAISRLLFLLFYL